MGVVHSITYWEKVEFFMVCFSFISLYIGITRISYGSRPASIQAGKGSKAPYPTKGQDACDQTATAEPAGSRTDRTGQNEDTGVCKVQAGIDYYGHTFFNVYVLPPLGVSGYPSATAHPRKRRQQCPGLGAIHRFTMKR